MGGEVVVGRKNSTWSLQELVGTKLGRGYRSLNKNMEVVGVFGGQTES